ncbi:MAG: hypothetical protein F9K40_14300 [Kofleriaceae bacterium]|nr:MAG: hypothetical protein F9K40_14300 [Kofleriaceae bacterium]MBZ0233770.1 hypothetical protein [Kofleriaceae bacterium]
MRKSGLYVLCLAAACGGSRKTTTTPGNTGDGTGTGAVGGGAVTAAELWAPVMKPGAIFTFNDRMPDGPTPEEFNTVEATVDEVKEIEGGKVAMLSWTIDGEPLEASNLPRAIFVTASGVRFQSDLTGEPTEDQWPATTATADLDKGDYSLYIHDGQLAGERCYGLGPAKDAGECEDVCFAEVCVHPKHGLTGGSGTWWPDFGEFQRRDLTK